MALVVGMLEPKNDSLFFSQKYDWSFEYQNGFDI